MLGGLTIAGVDGPWVDQRYLKFEQQYFYTRNLESEGLGLQIRPDLVTCIEVGEHLSPSRAGTLCKDLTSFGAPILFSAAVPGQGGHGHQNEQYMSYWAELFYNLGYLPVDFLHEFLWVDESLPFWLRQNPVVFYPLSKISGWRKNYLVNNSTTLDRIHPELHKIRFNS